MNSASPRDHDAGEDRARRDNEPKGEALAEQHQAEAKSA